MTTQTARCNDEDDCYLFVACCILSTSSLTCPSPSPHYSVRCLKAVHLVYLPCYSHGVRLTPSYYFVLDHLFINQILYFLPPVALMCLAITTVTIPSITERPSAQLHWPPHSPPSSHSPQPHWPTPHYWEIYRPQFSIYPIHLGLQALFWILEPRRCDR